MPAFFNVNLAHGDIRISVILNARRNATQHFVGCELGRIIMSNINLSALSEQAWSLVETNQLVEARSLFKQICEIDESDPEAWMMLGALHAEFSEDEEAISCLDKALELDPTYPDAHFNLAKLLVKQRHIKEAQNHCQIALNNDPAYAAAWQLLGVIQEILGNITDSEICSRKAIALVPGDAISHANLALALWKQDRLQESVQSYRRSLDLNPQQADIWIQLAAVYSHLHMFTEAEHCYQKVIGIDPGKYEAYELLGDILSKQGKIKEEIDIFRKALRIKPDNAGIHLRLGYALQALKQWDAATAAFQEVIRLAPENAKAYFGLGAVYEAKGMKQEEIECFQHALSLDPENDQYQFHVARLTGATVPTAPADYVRDLFDACAENFDAVLVGQLAYKTPELIHRAVIELTGTVNKELDVLDLGCGTGLCAPLFKPLAHNLSGIDLSEKMVEIARRLNVYDHLMVGDISKALEGLNEVHDLIIAADVFVYIGELARVFELCSTALKSSGLFAFSVEATKDELADFVLGPAGRYSHSRQYLTTLALSSGLEVSTIQNAVLRMESGNPVNGYIVVMRRQGEKSARSFPADHAAH